MPTPPVFYQPEGQREGQRPVLFLRRAGGPWLEVCLKTHYTDLDRPWETRQYLIEDTYVTF